MFEPNLRHNVKRVSLNIQFFSPSVLEECGEDIYIYIIQNIHVFHIYVYVNYIFHVSEAQDIAWFLEIQTIPNIYCLSDLIHCLFFVRS